MIVSRTQVRAAALACALLLVAGGAWAGETQGPISGPGVAAVGGLLSQPQPSGNSTPDSTTTTTNGGTQSNAGDWNVQTGSAHFYGPDGSELVRVGLGGLGTTEFINLLPGTYGVGATVQSYSAVDQLAPLNLTAWGVAPINFGNGSGDILSLLDPGAAAVTKLTVTPGTIAGFGTVSIGAPSGYFNSTSINLALNGGLSIGTTAISRGAGSLSLGTNTQVYGPNNLFSGSYAADYSGALIDARCHMSSFQPPAYSFGGNQACEQTIGVALTGSASVSVSGRMTLDGTTTTKIMPVQTNQHGSFEIEAECSKAGASDQALWFVRGGFSLLSGTLVFNTVTGTGATSSTGALSTMTLAVTADTTNKVPNVTPTLPSGVTTGAVYCDAQIRWMGRIT